MGMNNKEVEGWIRSIPLLTELNAEQERAFMEMIGNPGLEALIGLLLGERQGLYVQLSLVRLGTEEARHHASVLQGKIQGIERVVDTVREMALLPNSNETNERSQ